MLKGQIDGNGLFDGINALGAQIGDGTSTVNLSGGIRIDRGRITATAYQGDATALILKSGATAQTIDNDRGVISAQTETIADASKTARALLEKKGSA